MKLAELREILIGSEVADIVLGGFVYADGDETRFHFLLDAYYLDIRRGLVSFAKRGYSSEGAITVVPRVPLAPDLDDDMTFATTSVREMHLKCPESVNRIRHVSIWGAVEKEREVWFQALSVTLETRQVLFLDPSQYVGMKLGGLDEQNDWLSSARARGEDLVRVDIS